MFSFFRRLLFLWPRKQRKVQKAFPEPAHPFYPVPLKLADKTKIMGELIGHSIDIIFRRFQLGGSGKNAVAVYVEGLVKTDEQGKALFKSLMQLSPDDVKGSKSAQKYETIKNNMIFTGQLTEHDDLWEASLRVLAGDTVLLLDGVKKVLSVTLRNPPQRSVEAPKREMAVRGPLEGFTELLQTNMLLIRRRLKHPDLTFENLRGGTYTNTDVAIAYLRGVANPKIVEEVRRRLRRITHTDSILESGQIEELIEDDPYSPFPQVEHTERPDKVAAQLLEGRVVILTDGTPLVLIVPVLFWQFIQSSDDYYERIFSSFLRLGRVAALAVALFLPSIYIALTTYHQEMIPFSLLLSIKVAREGVPFPAFIEALIMEVLFELLREAGIRLPMQIGQAISIVGAIILGQAAIQANLVSPAMVIIVAITAISSYLIPAYNVSIALRLLRFGVMFLAAALGLFGVLLAAMFLLTHLVALRSFGVPYMSPLAPLNLHDLKDIFFRPPKWATDRRPSVLRPLDRVRQDDRLKPGPEQ
ncbi:MAG: spore germination protein [Dethiobacteria bacterium]|jgi:spore germination protein KA